MICKKCCEAADTGNAELHCSEEKCPCQHRNSGAWEGKRA